MKCDCESGSKVFTIRSATCGIARVGVAGGTIVDKLVDGVIPSLSTELNEVSAGDTLLRGKGKSILGS